MGTQMKTRLFFSSLVLLAFLVNACSFGGSGTPSATPTEIAAVYAVYTEVAMTLMAQAGPVEATATLWPTLRPTDAVRPTIQKFATNSGAQPPTVTVPPGAESAVGCDNSAYTSDETIPDNTIIAPGQAFTKTWGIQNTGSCAWSTGYGIGLINGDAMSGSLTLLTSPVGVDQARYVSVNMIAPNTPGTYTSYWRMVNANGTYFGQTVYLQIIVSKNAPTYTLTPTSTATASITATAGSATATRTKTAVPVNTLTPTVTATSTTAPTRTATITATETLPEPPTVTPTETETATP
jgi:Ig-like domain from next to BRCA1 gene